MKRKTLNTTPPIGQPFGFSFFAGRARRTPPDISISINPERLSVVGRGRRTPPRIPSASASTPEITPPTLGARASRPHFSCATSRNHNILLYLINLIRANIFFSALSIRAKTTLIISASSIFLLLSSSSIPARASAKPSSPSSLRPYVSKLLSQKKLIYWYTNLADGGQRDLAADGTFSSANMIEAGDMSPRYRELLQSYGIIPVAHVEFDGDMDSARLYSAVNAPIKLGWNAIALDEFMRGGDYSKMIAVLKKVRAKNPAIVIVAWCQTGAPVSALSPYIDLFILDPAGPRDNGAFIRESGAAAMDARFADAASAVRNSGPDGAKALEKTILAVCVCDSFDDASADRNALTCDNRSDIDFRKFTEAQLQRASYSPAFNGGAAFFADYRSRPGAVRFANKLAKKYFPSAGAKSVTPLDKLASPVLASGFESGATASWALEGGGAYIANYRDGGLPPSLQYGHAVSGDPPRPTVSHEYAGLRMRAAQGSCNSAQQILSLEPGATYEVSAFIAGEKGGEKASIWLYDKDRGRDAFNAFLPVSVTDHSAWRNPRLIFTLPGRTSSVALLLSDCDARGAQTVWWDFVQLDKILPPAPVPYIVEANPVFNTLDGYGFHLQWTAPAFDGVSFSQLQYSLDGANWSNIASEFDGVYFMDWLPRGMTTLPFDRIAPGQQVFFRVRIVLWGDKETAWSEPFISVMPAYNGAKTPVLDYAVALSRLRGDQKARGLRAAWLPPVKKPIAYHLQYLDPAGKWRTLAKAKPGAEYIDFPGKVPSGATLFRIKALYKDSETISNIVPLMK